MGDESPNVTHPHNAPLCYNGRMINGTNLLEGLNQAQAEAVTAVEGPLLIVAGPGSGKTRVITHRIAHLVHNHGIRPHRIAAMTFTNKAAREMRDRVARLVGPGANNVTGGTFHSFCARLLRRHGEMVGLNPNYSIYDSDDQISLLKQSLQMAEIDPKRIPPRTVQSIISRAKSVLMNSQALERAAGDYFEKAAAEVYYYYEELLARNNAVDFDDLLLKTVLLLENGGELRRMLQQQYQFLMIDEFQDTNVAQYRLSQLLTGEAHNICVVGDPDQSIYSWRNADIRNILSFQHDYPEAQVVALEQNYRSTAAILSAAKSLISSNSMRLDKDLYTNNGDGEPVVVHEAYDEEEEAAYVISEIDRLVRQEKVPAGSCAVMYRVNAQSRALEEACLQLGMKYRLVGGVRFYQRREVKDLLAYLHLLQNPQDEINLGRVINVPPRGIGAKSIQTLLSWSQGQDISLYQAMQRVAASKNAGERCPVQLTSRAVNSVTAFVAVAERLMDLRLRVPIVKLIDLTLQESGLDRHIRDRDDSPEERWENILGLRELAQEFNAEDPPDGLSSFLERVALVAEVDNYEEASDSLTLITLHQAKGLEFPVVFMVGLEEGLLPHSRSLESEAGLEEERRLCYVGMTRAERKLYLLRAFRRGFMGFRGPAVASRFLNEIPAYNVAAAPEVPRQSTTPSRVVTSDPWLAAAMSAAPAPARPSMTVGDSVRHAKFGEGVVQAVAASNGDVEVTVEFAGGLGTKRLLLSFAPLEVIKS